MDKLPQNSLGFAKIQYDLGIKGSYYFRAVPESWDEKIIKEINSMGHEIGYHYECLTTTNGNVEEGIMDFEKNLNALRKLIPVSTICMHGSPMSKWNSKDLWKHYKYEDYGIIAEPYFDVDFDNVFYLTDTGRRWDGYNVSIRDKVQSSKFKGSYLPAPKIAKKQVLRVLSKIQGLSTKKLRLLTVFLVLFISFLKNNSFINNCV